MAMLETLDSDNSDARGNDYHTKGWEAYLWLDSDVWFKVPLHKAITNSAKKQSWIHGSR